MKLHKLRGLWTNGAAAAGALLALPAAAQPAAVVPPIQTAAEALAQDAAEYARRHGVAPDEAMRRLRAQEESVAATEEIARTYAGRFAGASIEHAPEYRIVVLLTGTRPVAPRTIRAGGMNVPVVFRTGAGATREEIVEAMTRRRDTIRSMVRNPQGMGFDGRTGELVVLARAEDVDAARAAAAQADLEDALGVPVRVRILNGVQRNLDVEGGARVSGIDPADGRRYYCTTGFVVTDGTRRGIVTAAHCPDALSYQNPGGGQIPLSFVGGWGARYQDVQVHVGEGIDLPLFYADSRKAAARFVTGARSRTSTRAGDMVCHRGETTGYSCAEVELTDYAPPGELCGGPCDPVWVTVAGPSCRSGDSGGPIFLGTVAFGIVKGANYNRTGGCNFYFYMSTDYLPSGWSLLLGQQGPGGVQPSAEEGNSGG